MILGGLTASQIATSTWAATTRTLTDNILPTTGESSGVAVVAVTAGNGSKGSYAQLIASTAARSRHLIISLLTTAVTLFAVDIGVGAAASEVVVIPNILVQMTTAVGAETFIIEVPFDIALGSRIAARAQSSAANTINVGLVVLE
jgi:hypothetical protein